MCLYGSPKMMRQLFNILDIGEMVENHAKLVGCMKHHEIVVECDALCKLVLELGKC